MTFSETLNRRVSLFREEIEQWRADHDEATACRELESSIEFGLSLYQLIGRDEERWLSAVRTGHQVHSSVDEEQFLSLYRSWLKPAPEILNAISDFEAKGFTVEHAQELRDAITEVEGLLTPDAEFFKGGDLVCLRDQAIEDFQHKRCSRLEP